MEFVSGRQPVLEAMKAGKRSLHKIWILEGTGGPPIESILELARQKGVPVEWAKRDRLDRLTTSHHQGVVAQVSAAAYLELDDLLGALKDKSSVVLVGLDEIQDPHNIGAILRSAGFFGVDGVLLPRWRTAPVGETAARVSSGAIEHLPMARVKNLAEAVTYLQEAGYEVIGADMDGEPLDQHTWSKRTAILMGNEGEGLRRLVRERCDKLVKVPGGGAVASLNVGAAAAIFLHDIYRRRHG